MKTTFTVLFGLCLIIIVGSILALIDRFLPKTTLIPLEDITAEIDKEALPAFYNEVKEVSGNNKFPTIFKFDNINYTIGKIYISYHRKSSVNDDTYIITFDGSVKGGSATMKMELRGRFKPGDNLIAHLQKPKAIKGEIIAVYAQKKHYYIKVDILIPKENFQYKASFYGD
jgi:hypothetical protein